jgi:hypothetical protein
MELIARSYGAPVRLQLARATGTYEIATEFEASAGGRFALRVEGALPASTRPAGDATAETAVAVEIRPRIFVEVIDTASRGKGRVVFADYAGGDAWPPADPAQPSTPFGGVGMPADARNVLTIGAANKDGRAQHYTSVGGGPGRALLVKPDLLGFDHIDLGDGAAAGGSWVATAFDGGLVACLIGSNTPANALQLFRLLHIPAGAVLRVPASWEK